MRPEYGTPAQATRLLAYTKSVGGSIAAAEYMNEPTYAEMGGAPKGYDAAAFGRDFSVFRPFVKKAAPDMVILGPGGVEEESADRRIGKTCLGMAFGFALLHLYLLFLILAPFLAALVWSCAIGIITFPLYRKLLRRFNGRSNSSSAVMTLIVRLVLVLPLVGRSRPSP